MAYHVLDPFLSINLLPFSEYVQKGVQNWRCVTGSFLDLQFASFIEDSEKDPDDERT